MKIIWADWHIVLKKKKFSFSLLGSHCSASSLHVCWPHTCGIWMMRNHRLFITALHQDSWVPSVSRGHRKRPWKIQRSSLWCLLRTLVLYSSTRASATIQVFWRLPCTWWPAVDHWRPSHTFYISAVMESLVLTEFRRSSADTISVGSAYTTE